METTLHLGGRKIRREFKALRDEDREPEEFYVIKLFDSDWNSVTFFFDHLDEIEAIFGPDFRENISFKHENEPDEQRYRERYDPDSDPLYRRDMIDAGRGNQLR